MSTSYDAPVIMLLNVRLSNMLSFMLAICLFIVVAVVVVVVVVVVVSFYNLVYASASKVGTQQRRWRQ